jgi:hypothetical protein
MSEKVLITGATGLVGSRLTELLVARGHSVSHLGRSRKAGSTPTFLWDPPNGTMDVKAFDKVDTIVHLAGANIAERRWTAARKEKILKSRIESTSLLFKTLKNNAHSVQTLVSASAIGYYGFAENEKFFTEDDRAGSDFLAQVTRQWESEVDQINDLGVRVVKLRIGIVLSEKGGALKEMTKPIKWGLGSPLGTGKQFLSWVHIDDLCEMLLLAIENEKMNGSYNATTTWCTNAEMTNAIANVLHKPLWLPSVPSFVLQLMLGEMADIVLKGSKVSSEKIKQTGYRYKFPNLVDALNNLLT